MISYQKQCIEPLGESKSDYEVVCAIADRFGLLEDFTGGRSVEESIKAGFENSGVQHLTTYKEFKDKGYYIVPTDPEWESQPAGMYNFYKDPENNRLLTPSGKIEFLSQNLAKYLPDDPERPPVPHWIEKGESHDERISSKRAEKYPLLVVSNHPHWRVHANCDDITWCREAKTGKVRGFDGYQYEPLWLNPRDAEARGIKDGDIVKIFNERGAVLAGAYVAERIMEGAVSIDHGARYDPIIPGELDRGGAINTITPHKTTSKHATGMVCSSFLVEVEKVTSEQMTDWRRQYPEAFEGPYDRGAGLCIDRVMVKA
jgi:trimethylamine-N-oxide reductase (cytochrome c)